MTLFLRCGVAMEIVFRKQDPPELSQAGPGELLITAVRTCPTDRRAFAMLALEQGIEAFAGGEQDEVQRIVAPADPTLDDMLAAAILERLLAGVTVSDGMARFAQYAALVREGLRPGKVPLDVSLEGVYLAILTSAGEDLTDAEVGARFLAGWSRLAAAILQAAEDGIDPFAESFLENDATFARERAFLGRDEEVYRQDVSRGERWIVRLPGGPPNASGLLLRRPRSILWKFWARRDQNSPTGDAYLLLGVDRGQGEWAFSTDPVHRLSLKSLAEQLEAAERQNSADSAVQEPWFDGKPFDHTLIAAPRSGSRLPDKSIIKIVRKWSNATVCRPVRCQAAPVQSRRKWVYAVAAVGLAAIAAPAWFLWDSLQGDPADRGLVPLIREDDWTASAGPRQGTDYALLFATDEYDNRLDLGNPIADATEIADVLENAYGFKIDVVKNSTRREFLERIAHYSKRQYESDDQLFIFVAGHGDHDSNTRLGYIAASDAPADGDDRIIAECIPHAYFRAIIEEIPCDHIFVVLDVCFGGTFDFGTRTAAQRGSVYDQVSKTEFIRRKMSRKGRFWLTSGAKEPVPDGQAGQHSPFAARLLTSLKSQGGDDGVLTVNEVVIEVERVAATEPRNGVLRGHESGGDFLFIKQ